MSSVTSLQQVIGSQLDAGVALFEMFLSFTRWNKVEGKLATVTSEHMMKCAFNNHKYNNADYYYEIEK